MIDADGELLSATAQDHLARNGVPSAQETSDRQTAQTLILEALAGLLQPDGLRTSPLGVAWTDVFDASVSAAPDSRRLTERGWLDLTSLAAALGEQAGGWWAVMPDGRVLAGVRIRVGQPADPVQLILDRASARGEVRLREVLELRVLLRAGARLPTASPVVQAAADAESALGGRELVKWTSGRRRPAPVALVERTPRLHSRLVVACSGVDGAGKTTLLDNIARDLTRAGVPVSRVWLRPGMGLGWLAAVAERVKRLLGVDPRPGVGALAARPDAQLRSRSGVVGWVWSLLITLSFVIGLRRQYAETRGVVLFDRHVADALATLEFAYTGSDLRVQRWMVTRMLPAADVSYFLDISAADAAARKPGDMIGGTAIAAQIAAYERSLPRLRGLLRLTATQPAPAVAAQALVHLVQQQPPRRRER